MVHLVWGRFSSSSELGLFSISIFLLDSPVPDSLVGLLYLVLRLVFLYIVWDVARWAIIREMCLFVSYPSAFSSMSFSSSQVV